MAVRNDTAKTTVIVDGKQGINELGKLEMEASDLRNTLKGLKKGSDDYVAATKKLNTVKKDIEAHRKELGLAGMTLGQLTRYQRELRNEIRNTATKGTANYEELRKKYQAVNQEVTKQNAALKASGGSSKSLYKELLKVGGAYFGIQQTLAAIGQWIKGNATLSDDLADVQKTTELTAAELDQLMARFKTFNTRTPRKELLALADEAGKMGKRGVDEISKYVEETNELTTALSDLGEDAGLKVSKMANRFGVSMRQIGSGINAVADNTEAKAGFITEFLARTAGTGQVAKIAAGDLLGYGAAIDEMGLQVEMSSTQVNGFLIDFIKNTGKFEKAAGFANGELSALIGQKGTNEGFLTFLERLKDVNPESASFLRKLEEIGINGERGSQVFLALSQNVGQLRDRQELANREIEKGTSLTNEYNRKNETLAANFQKIGNVISDSFINSKFVSVLNGWVKGIADTLIGADSAVDEFKRSLAETSATEKKLIPLIERFDELKGKTELSNIEQVEMKKLLEQIAKIVPSAITEFDKYGKAIGISTEKAKDWIEMQRAMLKVKNKEAIDEQVESLEKLEQGIEGVSKALNRRDAQGDLFKFVSSSAGTGGASTSKIKLTADEITALQLSLAELQDQKKGTLAFLAELNGDSIKIPESSTGKANLTVFDSLYAALKPLEAEILNAMKPLSEEEIKERLDETIKVIEKGHGQVTEYLRSEYLKRELTKEQFDTKMKEYDLSFLVAKKAAMELAGVETLDIETNINDLEFELALKQLNKIKGIEKEQTDFIKGQLEDRKNTFAKAITERMAADDKRVMAWHKNRMAEQKIDEDAAAAKEAAGEAAVISAGMQGAAAIESANTMDEAGVAMINTIRDIIKAYMQQTIAAAVAKEVGSKGLLGLITGALAVGAVTLLFNKIIPPVKSKSKQPEGRYYGGDTGSGTEATGDRNGAFSNVRVHPNELVIPSFERNDPMVLNTEALLAARNPKFKSKLNSSDVPALGMTPEQADRMIGELVQMREAFAKYPKMIKSYTVLSEFEAKQKELAQARGEGL